MKKSLHQMLAACSTEEEVKFAFIQFFRTQLPKTFKFDSRKNIDFYTPQILYEFKFDVDFKDVAVRARAFAQALYYIRRLKYGSDARVPSRFIAVVDKKSAVIVPTEQIVSYCDGNYDWDRAPSTPDKSLIADLAVEPSVIGSRVFDFAVKLDAGDFVSYVKDIYFQEKIGGTVVKKQINEDNFFDVFQQWDKNFGASVANSHKPSEYFLLDIEAGRSSPTEDRHVVFRMHDGQSIEKRMPVDSYIVFWNGYERVTDVRTMLAIRQKMDRMTAIDLRRFTGEFFTPIAHARKALEYINRVLGAEWWRSGEYRLWDMAAGTGNLEFALPNEALQYCYISTLLNDDAAYCKKLYPTATVFQYDYLNDGEEKLPTKLRADLGNPGLKWIVFINPPYATAANLERGSDKVNKSSVSMTAVRKLMTDEGMGFTSRELSSQFFYRIDRDLGRRQTLLAVFSKTKYINAPYDQRLRDQFFDYRFEGGFIFSSKAFQGTNGQFPVGFLMWRLDEHIPLIEQAIKLDVFDERLDKIGVKKLNAAPRGGLLNEWIERPRATKKFPPMSSALIIAHHNELRRDRIAEGFLASFMVVSNDFVHQNYTALLSGPYVSTGSFSITAENFEQCMVVHAVRRIPKATWLNDRDQFLQPTKPLPTEFVNDCVIWSLFSGSNYTTALANVEYEGEIYQIRNNLYPWTTSEVIQWQCSEPEIFYPLARGEEDRFAAQWLKSAALSSEATAVLDEARSIYKKFYERLEELDRKKFKIDTWDAGWYQVRRALEDANLLDDENFRAEFERLKEKLLPQIYELGFLRDEVTYFD